MCDEKTIGNIAKGSLLLLLLNTSCGEDKNSLGTNTRTSLKISPDPAKITQQTENEYQTEKLLFELGDYNFRYYYGSWYPKYNARFYTISGTRIGEKTDIVSSFKTHPDYGTLFYGKLDIPSTVVDVVKDGEQNSFHADVFLYHMGHRRVSGLLSIMQ